ncbi:peptidase inhibitor I9 [Absidia repens]|uniref:Peptidase inhibitor I9 n=1 Tax=Absidia repens TaxID=90262 RepID=A0A1X2I0J1_9FUNG|nr:peptidase inhibitor I9 [Absidia repens]
MIDSLDSTYIVALKQGSDAKQVQEAKSDIQAVGGKVLHEFKVGMKGFVVTLPDDQYNTMTTKDYVDFVEADKEMHI